MVEDLTTQEILDCMDDKRKRFCEEYLRDLCVAKAAKRAGYSTEYGYQLMRQPEIRTYIAERKKELMPKLSMDTNEVAERLAVIGRGDNDEAKVTDILKALELIGKHHAMFTERQEMDVGSKTIERIKDMSLEKRKQKLDDLIKSFCDGSE